MDVLSVAYHRCKGFLLFPERQRRLYELSDAMMGRRSCDVARLFPRFLESISPHSAEHIPIVASVLDYFSGGKEWGSMFSVAETAFSFSRPHSAFARDLKPLFSDKMDRWFQVQPAAAAEAIGALLKREKQDSPLWLFAAEKAVDFSSASYCRGRHQRTLMTLAKALSSSDAALAQRAGQRFDDMMEDWFLRDPSLAFGVLTMLLLSAKPETALWAQSAKKLADFATSDYCEKNPRKACSLLVRAIRQGAPENAQAPRLQEGFDLVAARWQEKDGPVAARALEKILQKLVRTAPQEMRGRAMRPALCPAPKGP